MTRDPGAEFRTVGVLDQDAVRRTTAAVESLARTSTADEAWVADPSPCTDIAVNQFVAFLKPEVTAIAKGVRFTEIFETLLGAFAEHAIQVHAVRVVNGAFVERERMMERHYGVINAISRLGEPALQETARTALREHFGESVDVLGGHQFLAKYPQFSAAALASLFGKIENIRLASGTYAGLVTVRGREIILLNGFHPYQLERFTRSDAVLVALEGRTTTRWKVLRQQVAGATKSSVAAVGSFRRTLFDRAAEFGLSGSSNGLHLAAGPLEGLLEMRRFFAADTKAPPTGQTCFDQMMLNAGLSAEQVARLAENPQLWVAGRLRSAFDLTEEMDAVKAAGVLMVALEQQ